MIDKKGANRTEENGGQQKKEEKNMRQRFKKRKRFKRKVEASRMQRIKIKLSGTMYMFVSL